MPLKKLEKIEETTNRIAKEHLNIETLETRNRDNLDFYKVSVWSVKKALQAAYEKGLKDAK